jgi:hypothetical protein
MLQRAVVPACLFLAHSPGAMNHPTCHVPESFTFSLAINGHHRPQIDFFLNWRYTVNINKVTENDAHIHTSEQQRRGTISAREYQSNADIIEVLATLVRHV